SARTSTAIEQSCRRLSEHLAADPSLELGDVAYTLQLGRKVFGHRKFVVSDDLGKAVTIFGAPSSPFSRVDSTVGRKVGFLIAGVGEQYPGMVAELYADEPEFRATVDECLGLLGLSDVGELSDIFAGARAASQGNDLARLLGRQAPVENVPACLAGVLSLPDALKLVAYRAELIAGLPEGAMLAVAATEPKLRQTLGADLGGLDLAIDTGSQLVLAGPIELVAAATETLLAAEISCQRLQTRHAYHSRMLAPIADQLTGWITENISLQPPRIPYASNVTGQLLTESDVIDPGYWARHMCQTVRFGEGLSHLLATGNLALVEIG